MSVEPAGCGRRARDCAAFARLFVVGLVVVEIAMIFAGARAGAERRRSGSTSIGSPNEGSLVGGERLPDVAPGLFSNPERPNATAVYGTDEVVAALLEVGEALQRHAPGAKLYVNDIGFAEGGKIPHHASHQAGRDVDLLFFTLDAAGQDVAPKCVSFDRDGGATWNNATPADPSDDEVRSFDDRRNWLVVRALVESSRARVQRIFVSEDLRARLLEHARAGGEPEWAVERAGDVMCEPGSPHDDHFYVRFFCTVDDYRRGCRDTWPLYPWHRTELAAAGLPDPVLSRPSARRRRERRASPSRPRKTPGRLWCP